MKRPLLLLLPLLGWLGLYLATLTDVHTYDALSYILDVDRKPWPELFHPHHLAYGPLGWLIRRVAGLFGHSTSAEVLLQATNAVAGAFGTALFGWIVGRATGADRWGCLAALLLGSSYAYWYYAVEVEVYTIAALFLIAALGLMLALLQQPSLLIAGGLGVAHGLATLFHQTNVLLAIPVLVVVIAAGTGSGAVGRRLKLFLAYAVPAAILIGSAYLWVGLGVSGFRNWEQLFAWAAGYTITGWWGGPIDGNTWAELGKGLSETLAQPGGLFAWIGLLVVLSISWRGLRDIAPPIALLAATWLLAYGLFFAWWEPDNIEFWIASLPPLYLWLILIASRSKVPWVGPLLAVVGAGMLAGNGISIAQRGDPARDLQRQIAAALIERSNPGDLIVVPDGLLELYLPFYGGREQVAALTWAMLPGDGWPAACDRLQSRIEVALASGFAVLIATDAIRPTAAPPGQPPTMMERFGLTPDQIATCYAPYLPAATAMHLKADLPNYARIASAQELASGPGWNFIRSTWGWRAERVAFVTHDTQGWSLRPERDPA
ncbi:MAG: DUF2723 domain-containing protein [Oscillochloris sp.]|nr:DUF2723 domain-containing protein [Oscillochloris sp.]